MARKQNAVPMESHYQNSSKYEDEVGEYTEDGSGKTDQIDDSPDFEEIRRKINLINRGISVDVIDVKKVVEDKDKMIVELCLFTDVIGNPYFGSVRLKMAKQTINKLLALLKKQVD